MIKIIPAIDLIDGENVRLRQGDYQQKTLMQRTPQEAIKFYSQFKQVARIHIIDLIAAKAKKSLEMKLISSLKELTDLPLQIGGGLREQETIDEYAAQGIDYFILGTRAIVDLPWLERISEIYPERIFVGLDAKQDQIFINGWTEDSGLTVDQYLPQVENLPLAGIIYTDINKDGMDQGPNFENTARISKLTAHKVIASGGVRSKADLERLDLLGITEAVVGKASHKPDFWDGIE
ncbi:MAG: 1-(5-phosphoribosyl)-5-((5-phosphoribosylamino)methylideneamino)imidazole-4-carboxamide isomerase [Clostridiaceae bacterium]|jgi:phosphoribosylformimino-5-aminoimidazole carboxamide ribotide isomerase|nr:HisA/HisF-related TIM barrel protein [Bacillota bacterium]NLN51875.1 1-(5-phosphoribosyl)-5-((5-phosphoribosylamino)methylideneamino)imidazole-4-carboxamide isomerase [Clostridiaceae bacterium]